MIRFRNFGLLLAVATLGGCFSPAEELPRGRAAYDLVPSAADGPDVSVYRIGVQDVISVRVFQEPDLSFNEVQVDASGTINFPLIGQIQAAGRTPVELSNDIEAGLGTRFIRSPQVVVGIVQSAALRVVVDGQVTEPGVYEIAGNSSLIEAIARAKGPTRVAALDEIIVFREIDGQRMGAIFNLQDIREGKAADPQILGGDRIVVGFSGVKGAYRDFLQAAPLLNAFTRF